MKTVWLNIFGPVFLGFRPEIDPRTPLDCRGSPGTSTCTKNQPRRPILEQVRSTQKLPPDYFQIPRGRWFWIWLKIGQFRGLGGPGAPGTPLWCPPRASTSTRKSASQTNAKDKSQNNVGGQHWCPRETKNKELGDT